ncbi:MAG: MBOAT family O-acyltransferase [Bacteroidota bacterium]
MLFNSIDFAIFLPVVFLLYWFVVQRNLSLQNALLVMASYVFYGWWDWRFLSLIIFSSGVDFFVGRRLSRTENPKHRTAFLLLSIFVNIGFLGVFKYFNFFAQSFADAFTLFGAEIEPARLKIILPVGISFYTFQTLSYTIDVYRRKMEAGDDIISFFAFVSFFPQLVAGPIERASNLLPQFYRKRIFDYGMAADGMRQILWGLFKKIVIADNAAVYANDIFQNYTDYSGSTLLFGTFMFALQIYGDFSGYSDIAIGTARLFGFKLMQNFNFPYFSRDIAEFWRRWHISLSSWFRDYVYIPIGGSRGNSWMKIRNIFVIFLVSGFWHGANWTFLIWGFLNALYFLPLMLLNRNRKYTDTVAEGKILPGFRETFQMITTFLLTCLAWVFFRADSVDHAFSYLSKIFSSSIFESPVKDLWAMNTGNHIIILSVSMVLFLILEWVQRNKKHGLELDSEKLPKYLRWGLYYVVIIALFMMNGVQQKFIYFQF